MRNGAALMLVVAALLAGCAHGDRPGAAAPELSSAATPVPLPKAKPRRPAVRTAAPAGPAAAPQPQVTEAALPPPANEPQPPPAANDLQPPASAAPRPGRVTVAELVGMDEQAVRHLFGRPAEIQDVPPARYWQYASASCVLRVFFFMEMTTHSFRALSTELTSNEDAPDADQRCLDHLVAQAPVGRQASSGGSREH